ncbi:MAG: right-handed parallel beta-helix repeat-containing protein [Roseiflexaceae bacterium]
MPQSRCTDLPADPPAPASAPPAEDKQPDDTGEGAAQSPDAPKMDSTMPIVYDANTNTIILNSGSPMTLPAVSRALGRADLLRELIPGEWLLNANMRIGKRAALQIAGPQVRWLKLRSDASGFVSVKAFGAQLTFRDTCVTSWDADSNTVDMDDADGRSFVLARDGARLEIRSSELSYLGYYANESYGVAWRQPGTTGTALDSRFGHNFYGLYSYEASDLVIRGNEVYHSVRYGIDPHTRANRLLIEDNISHHNGKQGIILAEECSGSTIRGNTVYANALHGIVIYQRSNNNLIVNNISYGNGLQGININDSSNNTIRGNTTYDNAEAGIGVGQNAADNTLVGNTVRDNRKDGISFYSDATGNTLRENIVSSNTRYGMYVKSAGNIIGSGNQVFGNAIGIYLNVTPAPEISLEANRIYDNRDENVRSGS